MPQVKPNEIEPCAGIEPLQPGPCKSNIPLRLQGMDGKWRCLRCNRIHMELVYQDTKQKDHPHD